MSVSNVNTVSQQINNNNYKYRRIAGCAVEAAAATAISGLVYLVDGVYGKPIAKNEKILHHIFNTIGTDVKERYMKLFNYLSWYKPENKLSNINSTSIGKAWFGVVYALFFAILCIISNKQNKNK